MNYFIYKVVRFIGRPIYKIVFRPKYYGVDNIPSKGAVILAGNHTNNLDAAMMIGAPKRIVHMMAKKELFNNKISNCFFRSMGCISVNRSIHDENAKSEAIDVLKNNEVLGIFPEGTVNKTLYKDNEQLILPFKYGAVSFAKKTNAYIVPFAINGKYKIFSKDLKITFGKPYKVTSDLESENEKLMNIISKMILEGRNEK
jgi:1-acyl-sn-glycerol-3-phosphate acyltransferase